MDQYHTICVRDNLSTSGIQEILDLSGITEVAVNQPGRIWFERGQGWEYKDDPRCTYLICQNLANALAVLNGLNFLLDFKNPIASVTLPDGERGQIVVAPATEQDCVSLTFRKPSLSRYSLNDYAQTGRLQKFVQASSHRIELSDTQKSMLTHLKKRELEPFFTMAVQDYMNILLVGGTGSGKTTFMKTIADLYPAKRRIFTIEDVHELSLPNHPNHVHLFYKENGVSPKTLIKTCMRMKPDHVFLAELRGDEAWSYIELLNTGHSGSITTVHANDCYSAFARIAALVKQSDVGQTLDYEFILKTIKSSIDIVCFFDDTYLKEVYFQPEEKNALLS